MRAETRCCPGRYRPAHRRMGRSRDEVARRGESAFFRATDCRGEKIGIPSRNQHNGIAPPDGACLASLEHRRHRSGNSTHPEGKTANRPSRGLEFAQARNSSAACASETGARSAVPGSDDDTGHWILDAEREKRVERSNTQHSASSIREFDSARSADSQVLAEGRRTLYHPGKCTHARSGDRRAKCRYLSHANLRRAYNREALANSQSRPPPRQRLVLARRAHAGGGNSC